ncbi:MAG TPA: hypothetical protein VG797_01935 [Phycisphaerales bacterium]|nr:hypothetical protein [Phycisphaerales bacterium]
MKHVAACAALALTAVAPSSAAFNFNRLIGVGDTAGTPFVTSDGRGFFVHSQHDYGDGTPSPQRPTVSEINSELESEWTTYLGLDVLGPTRVAGTPNNQADDFYIARGVYAPSFTSRTCQLAPLTPGMDQLPGGAAHRTDIATTGVMWGGAVVPGPLIPAGPSPEGGARTGALLARLTVHRGATVSGQPWVATSAGNFDLVVNGPGVLIAPGTNLAIRSYLVAQVDIADDGFDFDGNPYGPADVYDVWLTETNVPAPSAVASLILLGGVATSRPRRATR